MGLLDDAVDLAAVEEGELLLGLPGVGVDRRVRARARIAIDRMACAPVASTATAGLRRARTSLTIGLMRGGIPKKWDLAANFEIFRGVAGQAAAAGVDLLIAPECWLDGYAAADRASMIILQLLNNIQK